jgi:hypothetical protein
MAVLAPIVMAETLSGNCMEPTIYNVYALNPDRRFHKNEKLFSDAEAQAVRLVRELGYPRSEVCLRSVYESESIVLSVSLSSTGEIQKTMKPGWSPPEESDAT